MQKGSLPLTGQINFSFDETQVGMLSKGLIPKFSIDAIISFPDNPSMTKKKIIVHVEKVKDPRYIRSETRTSKSESNFMPQQTLQGICRAQEYLLDNIISKQCWFLFGFLEGEHPIPIVIVFYKSINSGVYSFKRKQETIEEFRACLN